MSASIVLGLDISSVATGWGVIRKERDPDAPLKLLDYGVLTAKGDVNVRSLKIARALDTVLTRHYITDVGIEEAFVGQNAKTALSLALCRGMCIRSVLDYKRLPSAGFAFTWGTHVHEYAVSSIRQGIGLKGNASKEDVAKTVQALFGITGTMDNNVTDAIAVALMCINMGSLHWF